VIGFLRFVGVLNAAAWFGAALLFVFGADPATSSPPMQDLLGPKNYPYFSVAIGQILATRYFYLYLICSLVALLHLLAEWLYFGKYPHRLWLALVLGLCLFGLVQGYWLQPRLGRWHQLAYTHPQQREAADRAFRLWHNVSVTGNFLALGGLAVYLWRVANPAGTTRFVSSAKFLG
jgi:hypothetical protein